MIAIDIPTLVLSSVILLGVATPFISYSIKSKKAKAQFLNGFNQYVSGLNLKVDVQEDWRNRYILGIDSTKKTLVYYQIGENETKSQVKLQELSNAVVHQSYLNSDNPTATSKSLEQVTIQLYFKDPAKKTLNLEIYNQEYYSDLLGETLLASKWAELINERLSK
ncbi:hypothetical protein [Algoriphagus terrigena]|uniref:hypothetical protein n=1 Tax=Algoriphagus terrigena TaxID=344884 RepID=UPI000402908C|nr:hypothetical protein [Algoriphagus terrigena]